VGSENNEQQTRKKERKKKKGHTFMGMIVNQNMNIRNNYNNKDVLAITHPQQSTTKKNGTSSCWRT
jgi:hypothetical protein